MPQLSETHNWVSVVLCRLSVAELSGAARIAKERYAEERYA